MLILEERIPHNVCEYLLHNIWMCQFFQKRYLTYCCAWHTF